MSTPYQPQGRPPEVWVMEGYPLPLLTALRHRGGLPHTVPPVLREQLAVRTPAQLRERIERRWFLRFSHLPGPDLVSRADEIALVLVVSGVCGDLQCEDGWLLDAGVSCGRCRPTRCRFDMRSEDFPDGGQSSAVEVARVASAIRAELRRTYGMPRNRRGRHVVRSKPVAPHVPAAYTLREPEPGLPTEEQVGQYRRAEQGREVQRLAGERARVDRAARAKRGGGK
jgi:hypothetical protein